MLIDLVRSSVLRCFCHTCSVNSAITDHSLDKKPFSKKWRAPKRKQPRRKRRYLATEIRCEEKSRGGMCYEVILAPPIADKPTHKLDSSPKSITTKDINLKLQEAEERRKSLESSRVASINESLTRLEEANRKREIANSEFIICTQIALEDKLENCTQNREEYLNSLKLKLANHLRSIEHIKRQLDQQSEELNEAITLKMLNAQENRDENMRCIMEKLKIHDEHAKTIRMSHEEAVHELKRRIQVKLHAAETKRRVENIKKLDVLKAQDHRRDVVRINRMKRQALQSN